MYRTNEAFCYLFVDASGVNNRYLLFPNNMLSSASVAWLPSAKKESYNGYVFFYQISPHLSVFAVLRFGVLSRLISHYGFRFSFPAEAERNRASLSSLESPSNGF